MKIQNPKSKIQNPEKGVSIYLAVMVMFILLAIGLGISLILISQLRMIKGMENSVIAFHAADTGIEEIMYKDKICRQENCPDYCRGYPDYCLGLRNDFPYNTFPGNLDSASYEATDEYEIEQPSGPGCAVDTATCPGIICCDLNNDGIVDQDDVDLVDICYGDRSQCTPELKEDANCDGRIEITDVGRVNRQAIPTPTPCDYLSYNFKSVGTFKGTKRAIEVTIYPK